MKPKFDLIGKICSPKWAVFRKILYILFELLALGGIAWLMFCPFCVTHLDTTEITVTPISVFENMYTENEVVASFVPLQLAMLAALAAMMFLVVFKFFQSLLSLTAEENLSRYANTAILISIATIVIYTAFSIVFSPVNTILGGHSISRVNYGPIILAALLLILYATLNGIMTAYGRRLEDNEDPFDTKIKKERKRQRKILLLRQLELFGFATVVAGIAVLSMLADIIKVTFQVPAIQISDLIISGKDLIFGTDTNMITGSKTLGYFVFVLFFLTCVTLFLALIAFCSRSTVFTRMAIIAISTAAVACMLVGLFGQYYNIVQTLNANIVLDILEQFKINAEEMLEYKITSQSLTYFYAILGVLTLLLLRRPYSKAREIEKTLYSSNTTILASAPQVHINGRAGGTGGGEAVGTAAAASHSGDSDPCPAFSALDGKEGEYRRALAAKQEALFADPSLPNLVDFIVTYARNSRLHLSYTDKSVATFLAGLGTTRLTILQGMSGTGKTSLPKIVAEALSSVCDIVEVESSWRDKNELLGYYNEFSKVYTPKKFTQALYRAKLDPDTVTFIVLDEMNLSRIEYYFSDFLSLMENEPDKREIKLLNVPIARSKNGEWCEYKGLIDGTTLKIPPNIWFIGTANRDESTYDISDKVYDRAHTMNFDKRAEKPASYGDPIPVRYLPAAELVRLFETAKADVAFGLEKYADLPKVEALLQPYNISFGNRIATQIESFVSIYAACFPTDRAKAIHDALDIILLSKVVKKLELKSVDDKETLANEFAKLDLTACSTFIHSLKED